MPHLFAFVEVNCSGVLAAAGVKQAGDYPANVEIYVSAASVPGQAKVQIELSISKQATPGTLAPLDIRRNYQDGLVDTKTCPPSLRDLVSASVDRVAPPSPTTTR